MADEIGGVLDFSELGRNLLAARQIQMESERANQELELRVMMPIYEAQRRDGERYAHERSLEAARLAREEDHDEILRANHAETINLQRDELELERQNAADLKELKERQLNIDASLAGFKISGGEEERVDDEDVDRYMKGLYDELGIDNKELQKLPNMDKAVSDVLQFMNYPEKTRRDPNRWKNSRDTAMANKEEEVWKAFKRPATKAELFDAIELDPQNYARLNAARDLKVSGEFAKFKTDIMGLPTNVAMHKREEFVGDMSKTFEEASSIYLQALLGTDNTQMVVPEGGSALDRLEQEVGGIE